MKSVTMLPEGYSSVREIDLMKNKKLAILLNVASLLIGLAVFMAAVPFKGLPDLISVVKDDYTGFLILMLGFLVAIFGYLVLHEAVHAVFFKVFCHSAKLRFGLTPLYAFAAGDAYYGRTEYAIIGLSPVVLLGLITAILALVFPQIFWFCHIIQCLNLGGAAGDYYVTALLLRSPADLLVYDYGTSMTFYSK